ATTYTGKRMAYEFRLSSEWKGQTLSPGEDTAEYEFDHSDGLGTVIVQVSQDDSSSNAELAESLRKGFETGLNKKLTVKVRVDKVASVPQNGTDWTEIVLVASHGKLLYEKLLDDMLVVRARIYRSQGKCLIVTVVTSPGAKYEAFTNQFFSTLRIKEQ